jgi:hypothetical protein
LYFRFSFSCSIIDFICATFHHWQRKVYHPDPSPSTPNPKCTIIRSI